MLSSCILEEKTETREMKAMKTHQKRHLLCSGERRNFPLMESSFILAETTYN
jgi:hypothetical protein